MHAIILDVALSHRNLAQTTINTFINTQKYINFDSFLALRMVIEPHYWLSTLIT